MVLQVVEEHAARGAHSSTHQEKKKKNLGQE
jgi:hypothetical protein